MAFTVKLSMRVLVATFAMWLIRLTFRGARLHPGWTVAFILGSAGMLRTSSRFGALLALTVPFFSYTIRFAAVSHQGFALMGFPMRVRAVSRVTRVRRRWANACEAARFTGELDKEAPTIAGVHARGEAVAGFVDLGGSGLTIDDLRKVAGRLCSSLRCRSVRILDGDWPSECEIEFRWADPLRRVIELDQLGIPEDQLSVSIGMDDDADDAEVDTRLSMLVIGQSGSGKSSLAWATLAGFQRRRIPLRVRVVDPAGGVELAALREAGEWVWTTRTSEPVDGSRVVQYMGHSRLVHGPARSVGGPPKALATDKSARRVCGPCLRGERPMFHVHSYTDRVKDAERVISEQREALDARLDGMTSRKHTPSLEQPHDLLIIDEMLLLSDLLKDGTSSPLGESLAIGRKAAYTVLALAQVPQKETLGPVRDLFPQRACLATRNREQTDITLGQGATAEGARCHKISIRMQGTGYMYKDGARDYIRFRTAWIDDALSDFIAIGGMVPPEDDPYALPSLPAVTFAHEANAAYTEVDAQSMPDERTHA